MDGSAGSEPPWHERVVANRIAKKGLRPRLAAAAIAVLWLSAILVFGIVQHLVDPESFGTVWDGMWWATQTVTTVGYGDVVPDEGPGRIMASILMIGGLSFFAVVTGTITSAFVTKAQVDRRSAEGDQLLAKLTEMEARLDAIHMDVADLTRGPNDPRGDGE